MRILFLSMIVFALCLIAGKSRAEWPVQSCSLPHRIPVTITAGGSGHTTETRIDLTSADFPSDYVFSADGHDVRIFAADDTTPVEYAITGWNATARTATIYIRLPNMPANTSQTVYIYFGDSTLPAMSSVPIVFPQVGIRLRSRNTSADPTSAATARAAFMAAASDVYDGVRTSITGLNNQALGGGMNYAWCVSALLQVTPATSGVWSFRYGGDFGRGGHLYVREQALEEQWNDNLWWAHNYNNTAETLEGSVSLAPGWHRYEAMGFEDCCDGTTGFQARAPGGGWQDLSTANFPLRAARCIISTASVSVGAHESCSKILQPSKSVSIDASSPTSYMLPGAIVRYTLSVQNPGQAVDAASLKLTDHFPANVAIKTTGPGVFVFTEGAVASGLGFSYGGPADTTDSVEFSTDGVDFTYTPTAPEDANVTHIRIRPTGVFAPNQAGNKPSFSVVILGRVQ